MARATDIAISFAALKRARGSFAPLKSARGGTLASKLLLSLLLTGPWAV